MKTLEELNWRPGQPIEYWTGLEWVEKQDSGFVSIEWRSKPIWRRPLKDTVVMHAGVDGYDWDKWVETTCPGDTHRISFNLIDGQPDCDSIKMERLT